MTRIRSLVRVTSAVDRGRVQGLVNVFLFVQFRFDEPDSNRLESTKSMKFFDGCAVLTRPGEQE